MEYVFLNKEDVFLEDKDCTPRKIKEKELLNHLDLPVLSLNLYFECFMNILKKIGSDKINSIFVASLNGNNFNVLFDELNETSKGLPFNYKIEIGWYTSTDFDEINERDELYDFVRARGWDTNSYFALGKCKTKDLKSLMIHINTRYLIERDDTEVVFNGTKQITLRMLIDSILQELTVNRKIKGIAGKPSVKLIEANKSDITKAKLRLIQLQKELDENLASENFEICADIRDEIDKCNKIIENGK